MPVMMSEEEFKKKSKKLTILGIFLVIIGFSCFIAGPILFITTHLFYLGFVSFLGVFILFPGFICLSLGTHRKMAAFVAQSAGPVGVEAAHNYGRPIAREMAAGIHDGLSGENSEIYCKYCGNRIDADSDFCKYCGKKQN